MAVIVASDWADALTELDAAANGDKILVPDEVVALGGSVVNITKNTDAAFATLMAQHRGRVVLGGRGINIADPRIRMEGFDMQFTSASSNIDLCVINGDECSMIGNKITATNPGAGVLQKWIHDKANDFEFGYNRVFGKRCVDDLFLMDRSASIALSGLDFHHNDVYDFVQLPGDSRSEIIRVGQSTMAMMDFDAEIHHNRVWNCDADTEVFSLKASGCNVHHNFMKDTEGAITLRQCHNCNIENNLLIGNNGIRFYGHGHTIRYNQIIDNDNATISKSIYPGSANLDEYGIVDGSSTPATPGTIIGSNDDYARCRDNYIEFNIIDSSDVQSGNHWVLGGGDGDSGSLPPTGNFFRYNHIYGSAGTFTHQRSNISALWTDNTCTGNIFHPTGSATVGDFPAGGYTDTVLGLQQRPDRTYRLMKMLTDADVGPDAYHYDIT